MKPKQKRISYGYSAFLLFRAKNALFGIDANLFYARKSLQDLEHTMNNELINIQNWLNANKLALNVDKSSFLIFHSPQKKLPYRIKLSINGRSFKYDKSQWRSQPIGLQARAFKLF